MSSPMTPIVQIGRRREPPARVSPVTPRWALYYANRTRFVQPGLHLWTGSRNIRVLPLPKRTLR